MNDRIKFGDILTCRETGKQFIAAQDAALAALNGADPAAVYEEYLRQFEKLDSHDGMTGLALLWLKAQCAADTALTQGWANPGRAHCEIFV